MLQTAESLKLAGSKTTDRRDTRQTDTSLDRVAVSQTDRLYAVLGKLLLKCCRLRITSCPVKNVMKSNVAVLISSSKSCNDLYF